MPLPIRLEITPPRTRDARVLLRRASLLEGRMRGIHVIERPDRLASLDASELLLGAGFEPVWHLSNRGRSVRELEDQIARAARLRVSEVLCVRGEYKRRDQDDTPKIREVVRMLCGALPASRVAVTFDPFASRGAAERGRALRNLDAKLSAGAQRVQTQLSFDLESLRPFAEAVKHEHPEVSVWPMLLPVESVSAALRVSRRLQVPLPPALVDRLERFEAEAGWEHAASFARAVAESPLYDGLTLMTPIDPTPAFGERLRVALEV